MKQEAQSRPFPSISLDTLPKIKDSIREDVKTFGFLPPLFVGIYRSLVAGIKGVEKLEKMKKK